jgi:hypothetical protein
MRIFARTASRTCKRLFEEILRRAELLVKLTTYKITSTGKLIDDALDAVEKENPKLKGPSRLLNGENAAAVERPGVPREEGCYSLRVFRWIDLCEM